MSITSAEALRNAVYAIIDVADDLTAEEIRSAVMSMIPKEFHITCGEVAAASNRPRSLPAASAVRSISTKRRSRALKRLERKVSI